VLAAYLLAPKGATGLAAAYVVMGVVQTVAGFPVMMSLLRRNFAPLAAPQEVAT
jgi:hypothetical protein